MPRLMLSETAVYEIRMHGGVRGGNREEPPYSILQPHYPTVLRPGIALLETPGAAEPWVLAFPTEQSPWAEGPREYNKFAKSGS